MKWDAEDYARLTDVQKADVDAWQERYGIKRLLVLEVEQDGDALLVRHAVNAAGEECPMNADDTDLAPFTTRMEIPAPPFPTGANA